MFKIRPLFALLLMICCSTTSIALILPEALRDYDANITMALSGTLPISSALLKKPDIEARDPALKRAIEMLAQHFKNKDFTAFLDNTVATATTVKNVTFRSVRKIGEGGYGKIFHLELTVTEKGKTQTFDVAVKSQKNDPKASYQDQYLLEVEINNMRTANYMDNMLPYYGAIMDKNRDIFILTKKLETSLSQKIAGATEVEDSFLHHFIMQMSAALDSLSISLFVHNDIKTDNIMNDKDGNFYLIDFGEARRLLPSDMRNFRAQVDNIGGKGGARVAAFGSDAYKAPEKMVDDDQIKAVLNWKKADSYSMGLTLASLILLKQPNELWASCEAQLVCQLPSVGLTTHNFQQVKDHIAQEFASKQGGASKVRRAAMKLALELISVIPSERPDNMEQAYKLFLKAEK